MCVPLTSLPLKSRMCLPGNMYCSNGPHRKLKYLERDVADIEMDSGWETYEEFASIFIFINAIDFIFTTGEEQCEIMLAVGCEYQVAKCRSAFQVH